MIYIQRGDDANSKKEFAYNSTSETLPDLSYIVQTSHSDTDLGEYDAIVLHIILKQMKQFHWIFFVCISHPVLMSTSNPI